MVHEIMPMSLFQPAQHPRAEYPRARARPCTWTHIHTHIHTHSRARTRTRTHAHTHTPPPAPPARPQMMNGTVYDADDDDDARR